MMQFEINDILFFLRCIQNPTKAFDIHHYVEFCTGSTRSSTSFKLKHSISKLSSVNNFYLNRLPRLWNSIPVIDLNKSYSSIKYSLKQFAGINSSRHLILIIHALTTFCALVVNARNFLLFVILSICSFFCCYVVLVAVGFMGQQTINVVSTFVSSI